jgi:hypothetical protein
LFERPGTNAEKALLLHIGIGHAWSPEALAEFRELASASGDHA